MDKDTINIKIRVTNDLKKAIDETTRKKKITNSKFVKEALKNYLQKFGVTIQ